MTTAHKPTWNPAIGAEDRVTLRGPASQQISSRDLPGHTKLNFRKEGQNAPKEVQKRNFREELEERERKHKEKRDRLIEEEEEKLKRRRIEAPPPPNKVEEEFNSADKDDSDSDDDEEEEASDNETAELLKELERITKEREEEQKKLQKQKEIEQQESKAKGVLTGNPLLNPEREDFNIKKKWFEDVVFKNQTRGAPEKKKQRFINDTIRNDFHRKFLNKYVK
uniref:Cwf15/Cwc15 cell cycle control protein n=1 Tax=Arcella intermedia TaxID=1963864 RepID=A0A6B2LHC4_9EUKA|eukprot:TRINITY_DN24104_c0_g1_i1.p1 TRINITY_DN24104_c0_g1~~TRINITY_DN24104_c0_g1_i1.p1  ORF type:complete len:223 (-),score=90.98 TRINITY_DN24104_c0_g1_i1:18-686(-)